MSSYCQYHLKTGPYEQGQEQMSGMHTKFKGVYISVYILTMSTM